MTPTQIEIIDHLKEHYQMPAKEIMEILKVPTHPKELRDAYANSAMQALIQITTYKKPSWWFGKQSYQIANNNQIAETAYEIADSMMKAREQ